MKRKQHIRNDSSNSLFAPPAVSAPAISKTVRIEFDGGTPCNIPRLGYGIGYGSYRIDDLPIVRCDHRRAMSANAAEVWTLVEALHAVIASHYETAHVALVIAGDSKIALARCSAPRRLKSKFTTSGEFDNACRALLDLCERFARVETQWRGRTASVALFGH